MFNSIDWLDRITTRITRMSWLPLGGALIGILTDFFILLLLEATAYASDCPRAVSPTARLRQLSHGIRQRRLSARCWGG